MVLFIDLHLQQAISQAYLQLMALINTMSRGLFAQSSGHFLLASHINMAQKIQRFIFKSKGIIEHERSKVIFFGETRLFINALKIQETIHDS